MLQNGTQCANESFSVHLIKIAYGFHTERTFIFLTISSDCDGRTRRWTAVFLLCCTFFYSHSLCCFPVQILTSQHITWVINASALTFIQCLKVEILLVEFFRTDMCRCVHIKYTSTTLDYPATTFIRKIYSFLLPIQKISFTHDAFCWKQMKEKRT